MTSHESDTLENAAYVAAMIEDKRAHIAELERELAEERSFLDSLIHAAYAGGVPARTIAVKANVTVGRVYQILRSR